MTPATCRQGVGEDDYLLMKRGLFYRPNAAGYTGIRDEAGRYSKADAEAHADPVSGVTAIPFKDALMFAPKCWEDVKVKYLLGIIQQQEHALAALSSQAEALEALAGAADRVIAREDAARETLKRVGFPIKLTPEVDDLRTALSTYRQTKEDPA